MRVVVEDEVFATPEYAIHWYSLLGFALDGKHYLIVDREGQWFRAWYQQRSRNDQAECDLVLEDGLEVEARTPAQRTLKIVRGPTDWEGDPPRATLTDALVLLRKPFSILLENWSSDFPFVLSMAKPEQRALLERLREQKWLHVENGGGLDDMEKRVQTLKRDPVDRLTLWVLFDSDARRRGDPSSASKRLRGACGKRVPHHQLERRTIESYVTRRALTAWGARWNMEDRVSAFYEMPEDEQRHYFNMKGGLKKDEKDKERGVAEDLYGPPRLDPALRARLDLGFGGQLRDVFADGSVTVADLIAEGAFAEVNGAVTALLGWLR
jgi:hypothetical protein